MFSEIREKLKEKEGRSTRRMKGGLKKGMFVFDVDKNLFLFVISGNKAFINCLKNSDGYFSIKEENNVLYNHEFCCHNGELIDEE